MTYEIKKMYIHQKGLLFVVIFFLLNVFILVIADKPVNSSFEKSREQYFTYLKKVEGPLSAQTEDFLFNESNTIKNSKINLDKLYDNYYDGTINEDVFSQKRNQLEKILRNQEGFERIYEQYIYIRENPDQRYFLYTNGWDGLLSNENLDFLTVILILLLVTPVLCHEFECSMDLIALTMKKGGWHQIIQKILLVLISIFLLGLFTFGLRYLFFDFKYGLAHGDYPLQSLTYYSTTTKNVSLIEAFIYTSSIKMVGYLNFSILVLLLSICIKRYALTLLTSTAAILIPYLGMESSTAKYIFTGPLGLLLATGFFRGNLYETDQLTNEASLYFQEMSIDTILILISIILCVTVFMFLILIYLHSNVWQKQKRRNVKRAIAISIMLFIGLIETTGCSAQVKSEYDIYNYHSYMLFQNSKFRFYVDETDLENIHLVFENLESGKIGDFVRTPLKSSIQIARAVYGNGDYVYYIKYNLNKEGFHESIDRLSVVEVDTKNFDEKIIFDKNIDVTEKFFMGAASISNEDSSNLQGISAFFLDEDNIYFIGNDIYEVNRITRKITTLDIPVEGNIAYDGHRIYFIGDRYQLSYYDTTMKSFVIIPEIIATKFFLTDNEILYLNRLDQKKMYAFNLLDNSNRKVLDKTVLDFSCDKKYIYYQGEDLLKYQIER
jgi:hypothetical protein